LHEEKRFKIQFKTLKKTNEMVKKEEVGGLRLKKPIETDKMEEIVDFRLENTMKIPLKPLKNYK